MDAGTHSPAQRDEERVGSTPPDRPSAGDERLDNQNEIGRPGDSMPTVYRVWGRCRSSHPIVGVGLAYCEEAYAIGHAESMRDVQYAGCSR